MNYEKDIQIDCDALDVEWLDQPGLMMKYTRHAAECQRIEELAKEKFELIEAELDKMIRSNPEDFDLLKLTETIVQNTILLQKEYINANGKYIDTKFENNVAKGAVRAMDTRKQSLENLVKLHGQQYFAGPKVPRDLSKEWQQREKQKRADKAVGSKMKRTRK